MDGGDEKKRRTAAAFFLFSFRFFAASSSPLRLCNAASVNGINFIGAKKFRIEFVDIASGISM
jgi:hypothetical protein